MKMEKLKIHKNYEALVEKFIRHSHDVAGLAKGTIYIRSYHTRLFVQWLSRKKIVHIEDVLPLHVIAYLKTVSSKYASTTLGCVSTALRCFFLYLRMRGIGHEKLADCVPRMKIIRLKNVPSYLNETQEEKFLASFDRTKNAGKRNYAIAVLLIKLGLRSNEALSLTLDDIKWKNGVIVIRNNKCRRVDQLPLLPIVGEALSDYLLNARPKSSCRQLFLKLKFGKTLPIKRGTIGSAMHSGLAKFGITLPNHAAHVMRRTLASRMIQRGASIKEIADVLRQRDLNTTMIYTKVNIPLLREVAMPWPTSLIRKKI
jgi:integrase/recombinase XerD